MADKLELFIGPCVLESKELCFEIADSVIKQLEPFKDKIQYTFKGSFDKANRSSKDSFRGQGLEKGLQMLSDVKEKFSVPVVTDFHTPEQAHAVAQIVDTLQVPAFLCRQTDMIVSGAKACAEFGRRLKVKKGQFLSPEETGNIVKKAAEYISKEQILLTERGTSFGYNNLIVDMASFSIMKSFGVKTVHDATHCVQRPGGLGTSTGGKREQIVVLAQAAIAAGADAIFMEVHPEPDKALSDPTTSLPLESVNKIVERLLAIYEVVNGKIE